MQILKNRVQNQNKINFRSDNTNLSRQRHADEIMRQIPKNTQEIVQDKFIKENKNNTRTSHKGLIFTGMAAAAMLAIFFLTKRFRPEKIAASPNSGLKDFKTLTAKEVLFLKDKNKIISVADNKYKEHLAQGLQAYLGLKEVIEPHRLSSIVGSDELKNILRTLKPENFAVGNKFDNVANGTFQANLHVHTNYSDGNAKLEDLLDQAAKYADKVHAKTGKNFIFALTDHDTVEGAKEAIKIIAQDPIKYQNLKFAPGIEKSYIHPSPKSQFGNPTEVSEFIAYSINPFCPKLNQSIDNLQQGRTAISKMILKEASGKFNNPKFSLKDAHFVDDTHPKSLTMDIHWTLYGYLKKNNPNDEPQIREICLKYRPTTQNGQTALPTEHISEHSMQESISTIKESGYGFIGLAHPAFMTTKGFESPENMIKGFKQFGQDIACAAEMNYQDYGNLPTKNIEEVNNLCKQLDFISTGGLDNHSTNIFLSHKSDKMSDTELQALLTI